MSYVGRTLIPVSHGHLEAIYRPRSTDAERVALVLHPHPLYGGTMHNKVVYHTAKALEAAGFVTLRINFRGVGDSTGSHDHGRGEADDARAALDYLLSQQPRTREAIVAGFSFGAAVAVRFGCTDARVQRIIAIGTPAQSLQEGILERCATPIAFIHGERDQVAPLRRLEALVDRDRITVIPGASHFFDEHLAQLGAAVTRAVHHKDTKTQSPTPP